MDKNIEEATKAGTEECFEGSNAAKIETSSILGNNRPESAQSGYNLVTLRGHDHGWAGRE